MQCKPLVQTSWKLGAKAFAARAQHSQQRRQQQRRRHVSARAPSGDPAKLARNTLYDVLCVGDSFGIDWTVFEAGISDQAKEAQARALEDGMQFSPNSKDVLRKTELAERKRKLAAAQTLNAEGAPGPSVQFSIDSDADVRAMHAALNMTEENFDTPSKPKPGRDADARRLFAAQRLRLLMGAEFYFNRMAEAAGHLLWLLVLSSDPAYKPEMLAKGILGIKGIFMTTAQIGKDEMPRYLKLGHIFLNEMDRTMTH
eukprot:tig00021745_g23373.t1